MGVVPSASAGGGGGIGKVVDAQDEAALGCVGREEEMIGRGRRP